MDLDLTATIYKQADVLALVPGLSQGTLQNWVARGVFEVEGEKKKHAKARWSGAAVIAIQFMLAASFLGVKPSHSSPLADEMLGELEPFLEHYKPTINKDGIPQYTVDMFGPVDYRRAYILRDGDGFKLSTDWFDKEGGHTLRRLARALEAPVSIMIEMDLLFIMKLNAMYRLKQGLQPYPDPEGA
jgi:hypothetical protein